MPRAICVRVKAPLIPEVALVELPPIPSQHSFLMDKEEIIMYRRMDFCRGQARFRLPGGRCVQRSIRTIRRQLFPSQKPLNKIKDIHTNNDFGHALRYVITTVARGGRKGTGNGKGDAGFFVLFKGKRKVEYSKMGFFVEWRQTSSVVLWHHVILHYRNSHVNDSVGGA